MLPIKLFLKKKPVFVDMEAITDFGDEQIQNILNIIKTKNERLKYERCFLPVLNDYLNNYIELLQNSKSVSMETQLND